MAKELKEPWMNHDQLLFLYNEAADKQEQLVILAELNDTTVAEICRAIGVEFKPKLRVTAAMKRNGWTMAEVREVYRLRCFGWTCREIAEVIGHSEHAVRALLWAQIDRQVDVLCGKSDDEAEPEPVKPRGLYVRRDVVERVCRLYESGKTYRQIARETGLTYYSVYGLVARHVYGHRKEPTGRKRGRPKKEAAFGAPTP